MLPYQNLVQKTETAHYEIYLRVILAAGDHFYAAAAHINDDILKPTRRLDVAIRYSRDKRAFRLFSGGENAQVAVDFGHNIWVFFLQFAKRLGAKTRKALGAIALCLIRNTAMACFNCLATLITSSEFAPTNFPRLIRRFPETPDG